MVQYERGSVINRSQENIWLFMSNNKSYMSRRYNASVHSMPFVYMFIELLVNSKEFSMILVRAISIV